MGVILDNFPMGANVSAMFLLREYRREKGVKYP
jgi:hypothetical protein